MCVLYEPCLLPGNKEEGIFFFNQKALKQNNCKALTRKLKSVCELSGRVGVKGTNRGRQSTADVLFFKMMKFSLKHISLKANDFIKKIEQKAKQCIPQKEAGYNLISLLTRSKN